MRSYGSFSSRLSWFEVSKEMPAEELTEANCHARLVSSKQLLNMLSNIFIWFSDKRYSH